MRGEAAHISTPVWKERDFYRKTTTGKQELVLPHYSYLEARTEKVTDLLNLKTSSFHIEVETLFCLRAKPKHVFFWVIRKTTPSSSRKHTKCSKSHRRKSSSKARHACSGEKKMKVLQTLPWQKSLYDYPFPICKNHFTSSRERRDWVSSRSATRQCEPQFERKHRHTELFWYKNQSFSSNIGNLQSIYSGPASITNRIRLGKKFEQLHHLSENHPLDRVSRDGQLSSRGLEGKFSKSPKNFQSF